MPPTHAFLTRPATESEELSALLEPLGLVSVIQPAFDFEALSAKDEQPELMASLVSARTAPLMIFTSTRAVRFGLEQLPPELVSRARIAAIGPATSNALAAAGITVNVRPAAGFTSEALLSTLSARAMGSGPQSRSAVILAAPGGRNKMEQGLAELGWNVDKLLVYRRLNAELNKPALQKLHQASSVISIWTSGNAMQSLSQRLPPATWFKICQGDWLVISDRLERLARAYEPASIHRSSGPGNYDLFTEVRGLM